MSPQMCWVTSGTKGAGYGEDVHLMPGYKNQCQATKGAGYGEDVHLMPGHVAAK